MLKHRAIPNLRQVLPLAVMPALVLLLAAPLAAAVGGPAWLVAPMAFPGAVWALLCLTYGMLLAVKSRSVCGAWSGPAAMIMHAAWSLGCIEQLVASLVDRRR